MPQSSLRLFDYFKRITLPLHHHPTVSFQSSVIVYRSMASVDASTPHLLDSFLLMPVTGVRLRISGRWRGVSCLLPNSVRRIKCDERKPHCEKCTSTGRKVYSLNVCRLLHRNLNISSLCSDQLMSPFQFWCDGYRTVYEISDPHHVGNAGAKPGNSTIVVIPAPLSSVWGSDEDRRCFDFFLHRTVSSLSGFWDSDFWSCLVLRATHHQPAIRYAILALGSLHEHLVVGDRSVKNATGDGREGDFALKQYNRAIQQLINPADQAQQAVDVCLIACILFSCFEVSPLPTFRRLFGEVAT